MKYPIVVVEGEDMMMFETSASLNYLEAIDVRAGEYEALDSDGRPVDLDVDLAGRVFAAERPDGLPQPARLAANLRRHLALMAADPRRRSGSLPPDSASLAQLIEATRPYSIDRMPSPGQQVLAWMKRIARVDRPKT